MALPDYLTIPVEYDPPEPLFSIPVEPPARSDALLWTVSRELLAAHQIGAHYLCTAATCNATMLEWPCEQSFMAFCALAKSIGVDLGTKLTARPHRT
jgi:hypothetical protein